MQDSSSKIYGKRIYLFELFDESNKGGGDWEQNFGVYSETGNLKLDLTGSAFTESSDTQSSLTMDTTQIALIIIAILLFDIYA